MKLLVTLDGSHFSEAILGPVARLAQALGAAAEVELLAVGQPQAAQTTPVQPRVVEMTAMATSSGTPLAVGLPSDQLLPPAESRAQALARLEDSLKDYLAVQAHELPGSRVTTRVVFDDDVAGAIVAHARQTRPDLIAMATHGRTGMQHLLAGGVCERVIRSGVAPVLVLRA